MKKIIILISIFMAVSGCTPTVFVHNYKNEYDFNRDKYDCRLVAQQSAASFGAAGNPLIIIDEINTCLQLKHGWRPQSN